MGYPRVRLNKRAEADLDEIAVYTTAHWGAEQCAKYIERLEDACEELPQTLHHARELSSHPGVLRYRCERHVIYFCVVGGDIEVARILHDRMLPEHYL